MDDYFKPDTKSLMKKNPIEIFQEIYLKLPYWVATDIDNRMQDWIRMGGRANDRYMWAQIDYSKASLEMGGRKGEL
ncbi:DUF6877 family protein [Companilactobacillus muriivasis]|uniref:DUF6877 family protein n=1 Tax=Companilactobacillus muriivasis TaxID=3081444 RepID=UPI0030C6EB6B